MGPQLFVICSVSAPQFYNHGVWIFLVYTIMVKDSIHGFPLQRRECLSLPSQQAAFSLAVRVGSEEDCDINCQLRFSFGMSTTVVFSTKLLQGGMKENEFPTI